jgi:hypothetical protein
LVVLSVKEQEVISHKKDKLKMHFRYERDNFFDIKNKSSLLSKIAEI